MQNIIEIKHRIKSIKDTAQITRAMEYISIAKMRRAMARYNNNKTYNDKVQSTLQDILAHSETLTHKYLVHRPGNHSAYIIICADKGLAGGYNHNVLQLAESLEIIREEKYVFTIGQMAREYFERRGIKVDVEFLHAVQNPILQDAREIAGSVLDLYDMDVMQEVNVVYTSYNNGNPKPVVKRLLPVVFDCPECKNQGGYKTITYEPSPEAVLNNLVPEYIIGVLYGVLVESVLSEHYSRMTAMRAATANANEMLDEMQTSYHRARQAQITRELAEITGGII